MAGSLLQRIGRLTPRRLARSLWYRCWTRRRETSYRLRRIVQALVRRHGWRVQGGPFAGLRYAPEAVCSSLSAKLVGSYEAELDGVVAEILTRDYSLVINVGCAEGYYAVGLAARMPETHVLAFDTDPTAQRLCAGMARENGVDNRLEVRGACTPEALADLPLEGALLICDVEGFELELLRPDRVPALLRCDLLVELHDFIDPRITPEILARFSGSHDLRLISSCERDPRDYPAVAFLGRADRQLAVEDGRVAWQQWALLTVRN